MLQDVKPIQNSSSSTGQEGRDRKPNEARWKKEQTKDLLKAAEEEAREEQSSGGWVGGGATYRDTSVFR